jgi:hypothetical protein
MVLRREEEPGEIGIAANAARDRVRGCILETQLVRVAELHLLVHMREAHRIGRAAGKGRQDIVDEGRLPRLSPFSVSGRRTRLSHTNTLCTPGPALAPDHVGRAHATVF